jgi:sugar lactone lactonase YvrE
MDKQVDLLLDARAMLGEGPSWHAGEQKLYWVDIVGKMLHCYDPSTGMDRTWVLPEQIGCVVPRKAGGLVLSLESGFAFFDPQTGVHQVICDPEHGRIDTLPNDGKCDPVGRFWAGTKDVQEKNPLGSLYCLNSDLTCRRMETQVTVSNGITWNPDYTIMYYIDSPTRKVFAYEYDLETGQISGRKVAIDVPFDMGFPDGMTTDGEGMLWIAHWGAWKVARWNPQTRKLIAAYDVPARHTSSCCFGGPNLNELYITTARIRISEEELQKYPDAGGLFRLQTDVQGFETFCFQTGNMSASDL